MKSIEVVAAVITEGEKIFTTQRGYGEFRDYWEFPGGKIEPGETEKQALEREIREELECGITVGEKLGTIEYDYPEFHLTMHCFACTIRSGEPVLKEHKAAKWISGEEIDKIDWLPADRQILPAVKALMVCPNDKLLRYLRDSG